MPVVHTTRSCPAAAVDSPGANRTKSSSFTPKAARTCCRRSADRRTRPKSTPGRMTTHRSGGTPRRTAACRWASVGQTIVPADQSSSARVHRSGLGPRCRSGTNTTVPRAAAHDGGQQAGQSPGDDQVGRRTADGRRGGDRVALRAAGADRLGVRRVVGAEPVDERRVQPDGLDVGRAAEQVQQAGHGGGG